MAKKSRKKKNPTKAATGKTPPRPKKKPGQAARRQGRKK